MKKLHIILFVILIGCNLQPNRKTETYKSAQDSIKFNASVVENDSSSVNKSENDKLRVIVLPAYDIISNRGISPNTQKFLEEELSKSSEIELIEFPLKQLMHVPYQNIFDKKYCKPIIENVDCDIIVMTKLDLVIQTGRMSRDSVAFPDCLKT